LLSNDLGNSEGGWRLIKQIMSLGTIISPGVEALHNGCQMKGEGSGTGLMMGFMSKLPFLKKQRFSSW
jgi:hypothetical protein